MNEHINAKDIHIKSDFEHAVDGLVKEIVGQVNGLATGVIEGDDSLVELIKVAKFLGVGQLHIDIVNSTVIEVAPTLYLEG